MHHTFEQNHVVAESRRLVKNSNVYLTVDFLFYEGKLLKCNHNDLAWFDVKKYLGFQVMTRFTDVIQSDLHTISVELADIVSKGLSLCDVTVITQSVIITNFYFSGFFSLSFFLAGLFLSKHHQLCVC